MKEHDALPYPEIVTGETGWHVGFSSVCATDVGNKSMSVVRYDTSRKSCPSCRKRYRHEDIARTHELVHAARSPDVKNQQKMIRHVYNLTGILLLPQLFAALEERATNITTIDLEGGKSSFCAEEALKVADSMLARLVSTLTTYHDPGLQSALIDVVQYVISIPKVPGHTYCYEYLNDLDTSALHANAVVRSRVYRTSHIEEFARNRFHYLSLLGFVRTLAEAAEEEKELGKVKIPAYYVCPYPIRHGPRTLGRAFFEVVQRIKPKYLGEILHGSLPIDKKEVKGLFSVPFWEDPEEARRAAFAMYAKARLLTRFLSLVGTVSSELAHPPRRDLVLSDNLRPDLLYNIQKAAKIQNAMNRVLRIISIIDDLCTNKRTAKHDVDPRTANLDKGIVSRSWKDLVGDRDIENVPDSELERNDWIPPAEPITFDDPNPSMVPGEPRWGKVSISRPPLSYEIPRWKLSHAAKAADQGTVPRRMYRYTTDMKIFDKKIKVPGLSILIDDSGSMALHASQIAEILEHFPASVIGVYAGNDGGEGEGILRIVAQNGKRVDLDIPTHYKVNEYGGNGIDFPALVWLGHQIWPRIWVSDGQVISPTHGYSIESVDMCKTLCAHAGIVRFESPGSLVELVDQIRRGHYRFPEPTHQYYRQTAKEAEARRLHV